MVAKTRIIEGNSHIDITPSIVPTKQMEIFYNPVMKHNRDVFIALLDAMKHKEPRSVALIMEGTGIRGIRICKEAKHKHHVFVNDNDPAAVTSMKKMFCENKIPPSRYTISQMDADAFLINSRGFDIIDIDPFGSPIPFLDAACKRISRDGIIAITATDTAALCGTYPSACYRKYFSNPLRTEHQQEIGLRILIRKMQLIAMQYERAAIPIIAYSKDHYMRAYFFMEKNKSRCDTLMQDHNIIAYDPAYDAVYIPSSHSAVPKDHVIAGPIYSGTLNTFESIDMKRFFTRLASISDENEQQWNDMWKNSIEHLGFIHTPSLTRQYKLSKEPQFERIITAVRAYKYRISRTIFNTKGLKTDMPPKEFLTLLKKLSKK